ncbi:DUF975 family protein [Frisingicoccus sp.]|uniref:DUF975 family protein n=1 Tax=Frisingicoccus sp. TaxID=1918627 RepID=UPI002EA11C5D|nr:DUF975 family protein [Frisingicoccus sp.]
MWTRAELKQRAKTCLKRYHLAAVGACLILLVLQMLAGTNTNAAVGNGNNSNIQDGTIYTEDYVTDYMENYVIAESGFGMFSSVLTTQIVFIGILLMLLRILLNFFIVNPVIVGNSSFFYKNRYEKTSVGELAFAFNREDLFPVVKTMFFRDLFVTLWSLLFVIPGIVKSYAYRMVPYIISEYPQMPAKEALKLSDEMTKGHKWNMFVLDLSFFGWMLLGVITLGISDIVYTTPYMYATEAELYDVLKRPFTKTASQADVF